MTPNAYHLRCTTVNSYLFHLCYMRMWMARRSKAVGRAERPRGGRRLLTVLRQGRVANPTQPKEPAITSDMMYLRAFVEKTPTRYFARHDGALITSTSTMAVLLLMMVTMSMRTAIVIDNERTAMINITLPTSVRGANRSPPRRHKRPSARYSPGNEDMNPAFDEVLTAGPDAMLSAFDTTALRLGTAPQNIEKDFWVCWTLDAVFHGLKAGGPRLLFKGGTSLSKGFGLINASPKTSTSRFFGTI